jgi:hypothetical protein
MPVTHGKRITDVSALPRPIGVVNGVTIGADQTRSQAFIPIVRPLPNSRRVGMNGMSSCTMGVKWYLNVSLTRRASALARADGATRSVACRAVPDGRVA